LEACVFEAGLKSRGRSSDQRAVDRKKDLDKRNLTAYTKTKEFNTKNRRLNNLDHVSEEFTQAERQCRKSLQVWISIRQTLTNEKGKDLTCVFPLETLSKFYLSTNDRDWKKEIVEKIQSSWIWDTDGTYSCSDLQALLFRNIISTKNWIESIFEKGICVPMPMGWKGIMINDL